MRCLFSWTSKNTNIWKLLTVCPGSSGIDTWRQKWGHEGDQKNTDSTQRKTEKACWKRMLGDLNVKLIGFAVTVQILLSALYCRRAHVLEANNFIEFRNIGEKAGL